MALLLGLVFDMGTWASGTAMRSLASPPLFIGGVYYLTGSWKTRRYVVREN
ncbi:MAG: hypothetical protein ACI3VB_00535 [Oscillospiraceae bacterium]